VISPSPWRAGIEERVTPSREQDHELVHGPGSGGERHPHRERTVRPATDRSQPVANPVRGDASTLGTSTGIAEKKYGFATVTTLGHK